MRDVNAPPAYRSLALILVALLTAACASTPEPQYVPLVTQSAGESGGDAATQFDTARARPEPGALAERKIIKSGYLEVSLADLETARKDAERLVTEAGGYVEQARATRDSDVTLLCRVPAAQLDPTMDRIAALGKEENRSTSASDVTDQYADLETRLHNNTALRDRLQQLLKRATKVEDVLAIEKELNRVQSEVEMMQGRLDRLKSQVALSSLSVTLKREVVLGPLGYAAYGLWWAISKLFVID